MNKDILLVTIVTIMSIGANLPDNYVAMTGLDRKYLVIGLLVVVTIALVKYSKFVLVLAVAILALGANLPQDIANTLNIDSRILILALAAIILLSLANRKLHLPTGLEKQQGVVSNEGSRVLFRAVAERQLREVRHLLDSGVNVDARSRQGYTALMIAASHGHDEIVRLLLLKGADLTLVDAQGRNALQLAREAGREGSVERLIEASRASFDGPAQQAIAS